MLFPTRVHVDALAHPVFPGKLLICSVTHRQRSNPRPAVLARVHSSENSWKPSLWHRPLGRAGEGTFFDTLGGLVLPEAPVFRDCLWKPLGKKGCRFAGIEKDNMV